MDYDIILRPHHVKSFINFVLKNKYNLGEEEYILEFQEKNKGYHDDKFVIFWRKFLLKLYKNQKIKFLYKNDFDEVCKKCDIKNECKNKGTKLNLLVEKLDKKNLKELNLIEGKIYLIKDLII